MSTILVTGMAGTGKSTVLAALADRGIRVVDLDDVEWSIEIPLDADGGFEQVWRERQVAALLAGVGPDGLVVGGCASNQGEFYDRFDEVVLLTAPTSVLHERIRVRTTNDFGKSPEEWQRILADVQQIQPLLQRTSTMELDATRPVGELADAVQRLVARTE